MRPLRLLEVVALVSLGGSVLAVAVPAFVENLQASRWNEPLGGLQRISAAALEYAEQGKGPRVFPSAAPLTPAEVPRGDAVTDPEGTWRHPTWKALGFSAEQPHRYSFSFNARDRGVKSEFTAIAHGDLDGDGLWSRFEISGGVTKEGRPVSYPVEIQREVE